MANLFHQFHEALATATWRSLVDREARHRILGGFFVTGIVASALVLVLPLTFMQVHGLFDYEFANDHLFSLLSAIRFAASVSFIAIIFAFMRVCEAMLAMRNAAYGRSFRYFIYAGASGIIGTVIRYAIDGNQAFVTHALAATLLAALLLLRWYINDSIISNYMTAFVGVLLVSLALLFPNSTARMYQQFVLVPQGLSGFRVAIQTEKQSVSSACLIALGPRFILVCYGKQTSQHSARKSDRCYPLCSRAPRSEV
jgi:hypothetical protein